MMERQAEQTLYQKAASVGKSVEEYIRMQEDADHRKEMQAIEEEERADAEEDAEIEKQFQQQQKFPASNTLRQFADYETPEHGEVEGPGLMERGMSALKDKFPTLRPQEEVEARLQEKAKREGIGLTDDWRQDSDVQEEIANRKATGFAGYRSEEGREAARSDFIEEEAPPWEENPDNPAVQAQLAQEAEGAQGGDFEGFMPPEAAAGEQADIQRDENDPVVKEMKEVQKNPEARKEIFKDMPKEEKAMAKEELGNYYIGPGGYAINLETVEADAQRGANFLMLQHVPVHARAQMLANWGYIDQEDVDNLPDSPTVQKAKIDAETELAKQNSINETDITKIDKTVAGTLNVTKVQIQAQKDLNASNNTLKRELALSDDEFRKLDLEEKNWRFMEKQELEAYMHNNNIDLDEKKLAALEDHQLAQINLGYSKIRSVERVEANMLKFKDKQWSDQYKLAGDQEKRSMLLFEHTKGMDVINMAMNNGQLDLAAATAQQMGVPFIPDYKGYMTAHARASNTDPNVKAVLNKYFPDMKASVVAGKYATYKNGRMKHYGSAPSEPGMPSNLDNWISADPTRGNTWQNMSAQEKEQYNSKDHWMAVKITEATNWDLRNSAYNQYHTAITNRTMPDIDSGSGGDSGADSGGGEETPPPVRELRNVSQTNVKKSEPEIKAPSMSNIQEELSRVYTSPSKTNYSLKKGEEKFNKIIEAEGKIADKRMIQFKNKKELLDYFENKPELLSEPAGVSGATIGSGFSGTLIGTTKKNTLDLQHYVLKELAKRKTKGLKGKK